MNVPSKQPEVILDVAGEGGGYTIVGEQHKGNWRFWRAAGANDQWLLDDEDVATPTPLPEGPAPEPAISYFHTLEGALEQINSCWPLLYPIQVHPAFAQDIWRKVVGHWRDYESGQARHVIPRWREICLGQEISNLDDLNRLGE